MIDVVVSHPFLSFLIVIGVVYAAVRFSNRRQ
jgi:hypothetical protein